jgi:hypothetical protein
MPLVWLTDDPEATASTLGITPVMSDRCNHVAFRYQVLDPEPAMWWPVWWPVHLDPPVAEEMMRLPAEPARWWVATCSLAVELW